MNYLDQALTSTYSASGVLLPGTGGVPIAPELHANPVVAWVSIVLAYGGAAAALAWALWKLVKHQQMLPLVLFAAGLVAANIEPLGDLVGSIVYANDTPWFGYTVMGRRMPAWILVGASSYVAIGGYIAYRYISQGRSLRDIFVLSAVYVGIPEIAIEMIWHYTGIIAYYGDNPTRVGGIPLYSIVQNTTLLPVYGIVIFYTVKYLKGPRLWLLVLLIPATTIGYIVGVSWPAYQAVQSSAPALVTWIAAAAVIATSILSTYLLLQIPELRRIREAAGTATAHAQRSVVTA
ncbi:Uncharacterised protein [Mycobacteroides abscessus subsp. abscessus]|uniref:hypothetical protein n=1 Tax=Mycobacteroides abscessus TaxID=36809 RepID=UPI00092918BD|nr:hypothetical protein [Mycobacteroides abscessus]RIU12044.1 hypothetical protein D2E97_12855 [Mycobacteroides abscessus]SHR65749.1 Uncharacterised protein [Mycobacteroides abscessus subsp. abscessus]SHT16071.1 Uncharacterised protein [Mycobacteroides abscessus subsp. abscessus]SHT37184.1 Uncharacterised protein [Mycobacteroides abscessus subsp. abscessus]SHW23286.1 Uncharacterised protein [Mycobacteroides abscessus subsp. abscessus]